MLRSLAGKILASASDFMPTTSSSGYVKVVVREAKKPAASPTTSPGAIFKSPKHAFVVIRGAEGKCALLP
jgi:hypothetical protein